MSSPLTSAQQEAATDLSSNVCVIASAGSGKTRVLTERYIHIVKELSRQGIEPHDLDAVERVLVITFTEKATLEMKRRISTRLEEEGMSHVKQHMEKAWISTIHGFCARLLRENPFEAGVDPRFTVIVTEEPRWKRTAMERAVAEAYVTNDIAIKELVEVTTEVDLTSSKSMDQFDSLFSAIRATLATWKGSGRRLEDASVSLQNAHSTSLAALFAPILRECARECVPLLTEISKFTGACRTAIAQPIRQAIEVLKGVIKALKEPELAQWTKLIAEVLAIKSAADKVGRLSFGLSAVETSVQSGLRQLSVALQPITVFGDIDNVAEERLAGLTGSFQRLVVATWRHYEQMKRVNGALDNDDLQAEAEHLLATNEEVRLRYWRRFRHLLVDEFQDTSPVQVRLINSLHSLEFNRLFVVGDSCQSIYGFRGVDVSLFRHVQHQMANSPDSKLVVLNENFRSSPRVIAFVNHVFGQIWADQVPTYQPLNATQTHATEHPNVELFVSGRMAPNAQRRLEATAVAARIAALHKYGARWRDVAILMRHFTNVELYETALRDAQIPNYRIGGGRGYFARREIRDVCNALTLIESPFDDLATATALRSPMFGVSTVTITKLCLAAQSAGVPLFIAIEQAIEKGFTDDTGILCHFVSTINGLRDRIRAEHIGPVLAELIRSTQLELRLMARTHGSRRVANLRKLVQIAHDMDSGGDDVQTFIKQIRMSETLSDRDGDAPTEEEAADVVRIVTIHRAKGLEFPVVILPDLEKGHGSHLRNVFETDLLTGWTGAHIDGYKNAVYRQVESARAIRDREESQRLLYVALTRAKDRLSLFASTGSLDKGSSWASILLPMAGILRAPTEPMIREVSPGVIVQVASMNHLTDQQGAQY